MWVFLGCGLVLLFFAYVFFKKRILYPSAIFCLMWGVNCIFHFLIYAGYVNPLTDIGDFNYMYMDTYIIYFTIATIAGFSLAHIFNINHHIQINFSTNYIDRILRRYRWIMWLNFFGGITRIILMVSLVGFSLYNIMDYRLAANSMMTYTHGGIVGWTFRLTAYINMLAIMYLSLSGLRSGMSKITLQDTLKLFILFAPVQLATGGRLFVLMFIIFYFGSFFVGRGLAIHSKTTKWLSSTERSAIVKMFLLMLPIVVVITLSRGEGGVENIVNDEGSLLDPFSYISDGTMITDKCMDFFNGGGSLKPSGGTTTFLGVSEAEYSFRSYKHATKFSSSVYTIIIPLFIDFGYWGSLVVWAILAFLIESLALKLLSKMSLISFFVYAMLLKMCYESIMTNPFSTNKPFFELLILLALFKTSLFGKINQQNS